MGHFFFCGRLYEYSCVPAVNPTLHFGRDVSFLVHGHFSGFVVHVDACRPSWSNHCLTTLPAFHGCTYISFSRNSFFKSIVCAVRVDLVILFIELDGVRHSQ